MQRLEILKTARPEPQIQAIPVGAPTMGRRDTRVRPAYARELHCNRLPSALRPLQYSAHCTGADRVLGHHCTGTSAGSRCYCSKAHCKGTSVSLICI